MIIIVELFLLCNEKTISHNNYSGKKKTIGHEEQLTWKPHFITSLKHRWKRWRITINMYFLFDSCPTFQHSVIFKFRTNGTIRQKTNQAQKRDPNKQNNTKKVDNHLEKTIYDETEEILPCWRTKVRYKSYIWTFTEVDNRILYLLSFLHSFLYWMSFGQSNTKRDGCNSFFVTTHCCFLMLLLIYRFKDNPLVILFIPFNNIVYLLCCRFVEAVTFGNFGALEQRCP